MDPKNQLRVTLSLTFPYLYTKVSKVFKFQTVFEAKYLVTSRLSSGHLYGIFGATCNNVTIFAASSMVINFDTSGPFGSCTEADSSRPVETSTSKALKYGVEFSASNSSPHFHTRILGNRSILAPLRSENEISRCLRGHPMKKHRPENYLADIDTPTTTHTSSLLERCTMRFRAPLPRKLLLLCIAFLPRA